MRRRSLKQGTLDDNTSHNLNKRDCEPKAAEKKRMTVPRKLPSQSATDDETCKRSRMKKKACQRPYLSEGEEEMKREPLKKPEREHSQAMRTQLEGTLTPQNSNNNEQKD